MLYKARIIVPKCFSTTGITEFEDKSVRLSSLHHKPLLLLSCCLAEVRSSLYICKWPYSDQLLRSNAFRSFF